MNSVGSQGRPLSDVKRMLYECGANNLQLANPEVRELTRLLFEHEVIEAFITGYYDGGYGMMVATNIRLIFVDVMPFGRVVVDDIPYTMLSSTEFSMGIFRGKITLYCRPKTYKFWWIRKQNVISFYDYVEKQMLIHQKEKFDEVEEN